MDLEQLRCFLSVAELGSFSAAARRHLVTQPAVSLRLQALEQEVGERLIERRAGKPRLTAAGRLFRLRGEEALAAIERGLSELGDLKGLKRGRLTVGTIDAAGIHLLPPLLRVYHARHPGVELVVRVEPSGALIEALLAGGLDCAVVTLPADRPGLEITPLEEETLVLVAPPAAGARRSGGAAAGGPRGGRAAAPRRSVSAASIVARFPLIAYPRDSVTRGLIDRAFAERGLAPRTAMELAHPEAIRRMVEAGLGAAVLPRRIVGRGRVRLVEARDFAVRRRLGLATRQGEASSSAARAFIDLLLRKRPGGAAAGPRPRGILGG